MLPSGDGHDDDDVKEDTVVWLADDEITFRPPNSFQVTMEVADK